MRSLLLLLCAVATLSAADFSGTWKMDTAKSKYEGMPAPKELTVTYTPQGTGYEYMAVGTSATGEPIHSMFTYVKDGEEAKTTGFPYWDAIVLKHGMDSKSEVEFKRGGKSVGGATRTMEKDGKTIVLNGKVTLPDGKKGTYHAVYVKQ